MLHRLLVLLGLVNETTGPAFAGKTRPVMVQMYCERGRWFFSWYTEDHTFGEILGPFQSEADALTAKAHWYSKTRNLVMVQA